MNARANPMIDATRIERHAAMPADMRQLLRRATHRHHDRLDASSILAPLILPGVSLDGYRQAMLAMLRTYRRVDACLQTPPAGRSGGATVLPAYRARSPAMQHDLRALGMTTDTVLSHAPVGLERPTTLAAYLGMRYVIEGSQFGNRVIARNLNDVFGAAAADFCTAWQPCAKSDDGWPGVMAALSALQTRAEVAAALRGARQTFRYFVANLCMPVQVQLPS